jgi:hypothetical protein
MKLIYRGTTFEYDLSQRRVNNSFQSVYRSREPYTLMYRGATYQINYPNAKEKASTRPREHKLIYRGVVYFVNYFVNCDHQEKMIRSSHIENPDCSIQHLATQDRR